MLITYSVGTTMYATFATNSSGVLSFSTPQLLGVGGGSPSVMALSATLAVFNYLDTIGDLYAVAASISSGTLTLGTPALIASAIYGNQWFAMLTGTRAALVWHQTSSQIQTRLISISGTTITLGSTATIASTANTYQPYACGVSSTMFAVTWNDQGIGTKVVQCQNNSGDTITVQASSSQFTGDNNSPCPMVCRDISSVIAIYPNAGTGNLVGRRLATSGNGWSFGSEATISSAGNLFRYEVCATGPDSFVAAYTTSLPQPLRLRGLTTSGSTITVGSEYISSATGVDQTWYTPWNLQPFQSPTVAPASSSFISLYVPQSGFYQQAIGVSGTTLTPTYTAYPVYPSASLPDPSNTYGSTAAFSSTRAALFGVESGNDGFNVLTAYLVDYSTTTPTYLSKVAVGASSATVFMCATPLTATTVVVTYRSPTNTIVANVITLSGTTLSVGAQATVNSTTTCEFNAVSALSSSTLVAYYKRTSSSSMANVLTVSGTSISVGASTTVSGDNISYHSVAGLSATSAILSNAPAQIRILTISGTSISAVSATQNSGMSSSKFTTLVATSPTSVVCSGGSASGSAWYAQATVLTISGTTVTFSTPARTSEIYNSPSNFLIMFNANRGVVLFTESNMVMQISIANNLISYGVAQPISSVSGVALGTFAIAAPNYQKAAVYGFTSATSQTNSRQIFSIGAAN